jgi:pyruvate formate lyase activating enzyme
LEAESGSRTVLVVDVKRNSLDDGPGIRSVVFFKGCTLNCVWCQNPEALSPHPEIQREPERCLGCGACSQVCPHGLAASDDPAVRDVCTVCGACVEACPAGARRIAGQAYEASELADLISVDEPFYRHSGGGVTLSGGEPAMYPAYVGEVARRVRERGIHVLIETAGHFDWNGFEQHLLSRLSAIYFDLKIIDPGLHRRFVGADNRLIHENLARLVESGFDDLLVRTPLIPDITATRENLEGIAALLGKLKLTRIALLPYNPLWITKRRALRLELPYDRSTFMDQQEIEECRRVFEQAGIEVV